MILYKPGVARQKHHKTIYFERSELQMQKNKKLVFKKKKKMPTRLWKAS